MKYEIVKEDSIKLGNSTLYRIRALKNFNDVKIGDLGGYIEKYENLSQEDECWIYDDSKIFNNAKIYGNAKICDDVEIYNNVQVFGNAKICGDIQLNDNIKIGGNTKLCDNC